MTEDLPLPEFSTTPIIQMAFEELARTYASAAIAHHMSQLREAQGLSDERIDSLDTFALHVMAPRGRESVRAFAHAIADPLLARIAEEKQRADVCETQANKLFDEGDGLRTQLAEARIEVADVRAAWEGRGAQLAEAQKDTERLDWLRFDWTPEEWRSRIDAERAARTPKEPT